MEIHEIVTSDLVYWLAMRKELWPTSTEGILQDEMNSMMQDNRFQSFIAYINKRPAGFIEASIRSDYVNGTHTSPVGFSEGVFVNQEFRTQGVARALIIQVEAWCKTVGLTELASDTTPENQKSIAFHHSCGLVETERVVFFSKQLT